MHSRLHTNLKQLLGNTKDPLFQKLINDPGTCRLQIIYIRIDHVRNNKPSFKNYFYHYYPELYFNPASMVKIPLAFLSQYELKRKRKHVPDLSSFKIMYERRDPNDNRPSLKEVDN